LPNGVHIKDCWHLKFIPTFLWWVAKQLEPWNLDDNDVINSLRQIWDILYPNIVYTVEQKGAIVAMVMLLGLIHVTTLSRMTGNAVCL